MSLAYKQALKAEDGMFDAAIKKGIAEGCPASQGVADIAKYVDNMPRAPVLGNLRHGINSMLGNRETHLSTMQPNGPATAPIIFPDADHCAVTMASGGGKSIGWAFVGPSAVTTAVSVLKQASSPFFDSFLQHLCVDSDGNVNSLWTDSSAGSVVDRLKSNPTLFRSDGNVPEGVALFEREEKAASSQESVSTMKLWDAMTFERDDARVKMKRYRVMSNLFLAVQPDPIGRLIVREKKQITGGLFRWQMWPSQNVPFDYDKHKGADYEQVFGKAEANEVVKPSIEHPMLKRAVLYMLAGFVAEHVIPACIGEHYADELEEAKLQKAKDESSSGAASASQDSIEGDHTPVKMAKRKHRGAVGESLDSILSGQTPISTPPPQAIRALPSLTPAAAPAAAAAAATDSEPNESVLTTSSTSNASTGSKQKKEQKNCLSWPEQKELFDTLLRRNAPMANVYAHDTVCEFLDEWQKKANMLKRQKDAKLAAMGFGVAVKVKDHGGRGYDDMRGIGDAFRLVTYSSLYYNLDDAKNYSDALKIMTTAQVNRPLNTEPSLEQRAKANSEAVAVEEYTVDFAKARLVHRQGSLVIETTNRLATISGEYLLLRLREDGRKYPEASELQETEQELQQQQQHELQAEATAADAANAANAEAKERLIAACELEILKKPLPVSAKSEYSSGKFKDVWDEACKRLQSKKLGWRIDLPSGSQTAWQGVPYTSNGILKGGSGPTSFFLKLTSYTTLEAENNLSDGGITESADAFNVSLYPTNIPGTGALAQIQPSPSALARHRNQRRRLATHVSSSSVPSAEKNALHLTRLSAWLTALARRTGNSSMIASDTHELALAGREMHKMASSATSWGGKVGVDEAKKVVIVSAPGVAVVATLGPPPPPPPGVATASRHRLRPHSLPDSPAPSPICARWQRNCLRDKTDELQLAHSYMCQMARQLAGQPQADMFVLNSQIGTDDDETDEH